MIDTSTDFELGKKIAGVLNRRGIETPVSNDTPDAGLIEVAFKDIMQDGLALDMSDDSLKDTPGRIAKMYNQEIFYGLNYRNFPKCTTIENKMTYDEVVTCKKIDVLSVCEHHFVPFIGKATIAYIPDTKVLGLSKMNRVVDFFSRRPQVQERLTEQVYAALSTILETDSLAVVLDCEHMCVRLRGVKQQSSTTTSKLGGRFRASDALRAEFFALTRS